ncbi:MAG: dioxygenase extradiol [Chlorobi bacterium]|nr:dioxygenase extradiol [Chlorobiota bacterium]
MMKTLSDFKGFAGELPERDEKLPALFVGHGSPMNAIEDNEFSRAWHELGQTLPRPDAILCISAHWETSGTFVTAMERPKTIHDFGGFPQALFDVQYPAPGDPRLVEETRRLSRHADIQPDHAWGLDHGCWSVLENVYPAADIPVVQLSLDRTKPAAWHYEMAKDLASLRKRGVLILGSGNMVHNLRVIDWRNPNGGYDWAEETSAKMKELIEAGDHATLANYGLIGAGATLAIPTPEHYLPLLYVLALQEKNERATFFSDELVMGSIAMTSVKIA